MGKVSLKFFDLCSIMHTYIYFALTYTDAYTHRGSFLGACKVHTRYMQEMSKTESYWQKEASL